jgi:hypothetical protein
VVLPYKKAPPQGGAGPVAGPRGRAASAPRGDERCPLWEFRVPPHPVSSCWTDCQQCPGRMVVLVDGGANAELDRFGGTAVVARPLGMTSLVIAGGLGDLRAANLEGRVGATEGELVAIVAGLRTAVRTAKEHPDKVTDRNTLVLVVDRSGSLATLRSWLVNARWELPADGPALRPLLVLLR